MVLSYRNGWIQRFIFKNPLFIGVFVFAIISHVPYLFPGGPCADYPNPLFLVYDEGTILYDSFRITCGEVIYRDFFQFQGPVFYHIYAGLFAITGPSMTAARALNLLVTSFSAAIIALIVARSLGILAGVGAAIIHICLLVPIYPYAYPHWLAEAFALAGIYLLATNHKGLRHELAGGAFLGLSAATIHSLGLPILIACLGVSAISGIAQGNGRETWAHLLRVSGGALIIVSPFLIYLSVAGALEQMWYGMVEWVFHHYPEGQQDAVKQGYGAYLDTFIFLHKTVSQPWRGLAIWGLIFVAFIPLFSICGMTVATLQIIISKGQKPLDFVYLLISAAGLAGTAPLLLGITRVDIVHIAFLGSFGLCGAAIALRPLVHWRSHFRLFVSIVWIVIGLLVMLNFTAKTVMTYKPSREMGTWRERILKTSNVASWIDTNVGPDERIVTVQGGLIYLFVRHAAIGFTFLPIDTPRYYSDQQWQKIGSQISKNLPSVIEVTEGQWDQLTERTPALSKLYEIIAIGHETGTPLTGESQGDKGTSNRRLLLRLSAS
jgi:hypothetical protein